MRNPLRAILSALLMLTPAIVHAAPGIAMRWDHCYADGGTANKDFACDTNTGSATLVLSFSPDSVITDIDGLEIYVQILSAGPTLPAWWQFKNAGSCRQTSLGAGFIADPLDTHCLDPFAGNAIGGIGSYTLGFQGDSKRIAMSMATAVPPPQLASVEPGHEYFAGKLIITYSKTVGTGACPGCVAPMCLTLNQIRLDRVSKVDQLYGLEGPNSNTVGWQGGSPDNFFGIGDSPFQPWHSGWFPVSCGLPTPARNRTWGTIKSLYR